MLQRIVNNLLIILVLSINHSALAASGPLFHIDESGIPIEVTSTLCLNVNGRLPLSCQNYTSHHSTLNIIPTVPNHVYSYAGIKINTPGVTLVNAGVDCTPMDNGYCMFSVSNTAPKSMIVLDEFDYLNVLNIEKAFQPFPQNIIDPQLPPIPTSSYPVNVTVQQLEGVYDANFCQLNVQHNVTLSSPQCQTLIEYISEQPGTGGFDLNKQPIINNGLGINDVSFQPIIYTTNVELPSGAASFNVSGGLIMPNGLTKSQVKGVVVYFQGTQFIKNDVGSNINFVGTQIVAAVYASQGYIVVIPDYIGLGVDWQNVHPYVLYPKVSAKTAVDMLTAVQPLINDKYGYVAPDKVNLFSVGYSEGGAYSLWFNTFVHDAPYLGTLNDFYTLQHSVGLEGAYSTSLVTANFLFEDVVKNIINKFNIQSQSLTNMAKSLLAADAFLSYATYSPTSGNPDYLGVFNDFFFNMFCELGLPQILCDTNGTRVTLVEAFAQESNSPATQTLFSALGKTTGSFSYPSTLVGLVLSTHNSAISFLSSEQFTTNPTLLQTLEDADVNLSQENDGAVSIVSLKKDSIVSPDNFDVLHLKYLLKCLTAIKLDENKILVVSPLSYERKACKQDPSCPPRYAPVDHPQAQIYEYLYALNTFNQFNSLGAITQVTQRLDV